MYYQDYEDYMRSVLGYNVQKEEPTYNGYNMPIVDQTPYTQNRIENYEPMQYEMEIDAVEVDHLYPETYKIIRPMVQKACTEHKNKPITKELVDKVTIEIYNIVEVDEQINLNAKASVSLNATKGTNMNKTNETRQIFRPNNYLLNDLIRILVLQELLRSSRRPSFPGPSPRFPIRPSFPGGPGPSFPTPRPPFPGPGPRPPVDPTPR